MDRQRILEPGPTLRRASAYRLARLLRGPAMVVIALALLPVADCLADPPTEQDRQVDEAIVKALDFLAGEQQPNGSWRIDSYGESTAATSLAVMSFLAAGHVPGEEPYGEVLKRGIGWVIEQQKPDGMIVAAKSHGPLYSHGISTLMLAEVVGMADAEQAEPCRHALERGVRLILDAQNVAKEQRHAGGWRYQATSRDSDLSVTGWQLLALRAAKNVGCDVPAEQIDRAVAYVKRCHSESHGGFAYQPGSGTTATRTGTGVLALEICGAHRTPEALRGGETLLHRPLRYGDPYFYYGAYYCSVGMFKLGGEPWQLTKSGLYPVLLKNQTDDGSWRARHGSERSAGSIYCTTMAVLALAVEYRFLPIYQR